MGLTLNKINALSFQSILHKALGVVIDREICMILMNMSIHDTVLIIPNNLNFYGFTGVLLYKYLSIR